MLHHHLRLIPAFALASVIFATASAPHRAPHVVQPNANTTSAGVLRNGVLTVVLEAKETTWRLNGPNRPPVTIAAFAEPDGAPLMPAPLVRAPAGTEIRLSIRNSLTKPLTFFVPSALRGGDGGLAVDSIVIAPGAKETLTARATRPGNYVYRAATPGGTTVDAPYTGLLAGALVVDSGRAVRPRDRVLVIMETTDSAFVPCADSAKRNATGKCTVARTIFTINGRSWPGTERLHATVGDSLNWRLLNASNEPHPMHLHGFYYRVNALSGTLADLPGASGPGQLVVTQLMTPLSGLSMSWSPDRPGNWLFHCHFAMHLRPDSLSAAPDDPHMHGMSGLVIGVDVAERPGVRVAGAPTARRHLSMIAVEDSAGPDMNSRMMAPSMHFVLEERGRRVDAGPDFSPELDLVRGEPVSITIVNHLHESTSVHWHGIEVEDSYVDGVPGFSGSGKRLAPAIAPGDSFEARFTPRRSGTFMYHAHVDEEREQVAGLEGALIVRDPRDSSSADEHVFFIKSTRVVSEHAPLEINGRTEPDTVVLRVGRPARLRLVQLSTHHFTANLTFRLTTVPDAAANESGRTRDSAVVQWRPVAKDGADLPEAARTPRLAEQIISMGETYDFEYTPRQRGMLRLEVMTTVIPGTPTRSRVLITAPIRAEPSSDLVARIDSLATAFIVDTRTPGVSVAVLRGSDTLVMKGYGDASIEPRRSAAAYTVYRIGSNTKQFTAAEILRLAERGKLSLDDPVTKYFPDVPTHGRTIRIRQLLNHTSGLHEFVAKPEFAQQSAEDVTPRQVLALVDHDSLDFNPGDKWSYSNTGYVLLGMIIEKVTGAAYANVLQQDLFRPLGLRQTSYCANRPSDSTFANGYSTGSGTVLPARDLSMTQFFSAGSLCSTVRDLVKWQRELEGGRVVKAKSYALMTTPDTLNDGRRLTYGFGLETGELGGHKQFGHKGGVNGFTTASLFYPDDNVNVVVFSNAERGGGPPKPGPKRFPSSGADTLALNIARTVFGIPITPRGSER